MKTTLPLEQFQTIFYNHTASHLVLCIFSRNFTEWLFTDIFLSPDSFVKGQWYGLVGLPVTNDIQILAFVNLRAKSERPKGEDRFGGVDGALNQRTLS